MPNKAILWAALMLVPLMASAANTPQEIQNKQTVASWMTAVFGDGNAAEAFPHYVSMAFVQHGRNHRGFGYQPFEGYLAGRFKPDASRHFSVDKAVGNEDIVTMYTSLGVDVYRVTDGKIDAHWDASSREGLAQVQAAFGGGAAAPAASPPTTPPPSAAPATGPKGPHADEIQNQQRVSDWMVAVFGQGRVQQAFQDHVSHDFKQHGHRNQGVGFDAFKAYLTTRKINPEHPFKVFDAVGCDDMVMMYTSIGVDLYRLKDGKITDHWDASAEF